MSLFHHCTFQSTGLYKLNVQHKRALQMRQKGTKLRRGTSSGWRQSFAKQQPRHLWSLLLLCPFAHVHPIKSYYSSRTCTHQAKSCSSEQTQTTAQTPEAPIAALSHSHWQSFMTTFTYRFSLWMKGRLHLCTVKVAYMWYMVSEDVGCLYCMHIVLTEL